MRSYQDIAECLNYITDVHRRLDAAYYNSHGFAKAQNALDEAKVYVRQAIIAIQKDRHESIIPLSSENADKVTIRPVSPSQGKYSREKWGLPYYDD